MAKRSKSDLTREKIMQAAHEIFVDRGYHDAKVVDIIERAGCGHGTFYDYFKSKDDALLAILNEIIRELGRLGDSTEVLMERLAFDDYEAVRILLRAINEIFDRHGDVLKVYIEAALESTVFSDIFVRFHHQFSSILEHKILALKELGKCQDLDARITSQILVTLIASSAYGHQVGFILGDGEEISESLGLLAFRALNY
jgi:AcrR family transcriptional regulator